MSARFPPQREHVLLGIDRRPQTSLPWTGSFMFRRTPVASAVLAALVSTPIYDAGAEENSSSSVLVAAASAGYPPEPNDEPKWERGSSTTNNKGISTDASPNAAGGVASGVGAAVRELSIGLSADLNVVLGVDPHHGMKRVVSKIVADSGPALGDDIENLKRYMKALSMLQRSMSESYAGYAFHTPASLDRSMTSPLTNELDTPLLKRLSRNCVDLPSDNITSAIDQMYFYLTCVQKLASKYAKGRLSVRTDTDTTPSMLRELFVALENESSKGMGAIEMRKRS